MVEHLGRHETPDDRLYDNNYCWVLCGLLNDGRPGVQGTWMFTPVAFLVLVRLNPRMDDTLRKLDDVVALTG
jgi:hypothetical protein